MSKILVTGAGGAPSEGVINLLLRVVNKRLLSARVRSPQT